nr:glycoside-pentoside-hexuronide (GPH):cation symporter [uncultured Oscillibacter sp.]
MTDEVKSTPKKEEPKMCTKKEQLGHALGVLGHDSAYTMWGTWMLPFMTDILMLPYMFTTILNVAARVFDAFTDVTMGVIADRTRSKWGRFRPWVLRAGPIFCLLMIISFIKFPVGTVGLCVIAGILYVITGSIAFTAVDIPFWSLPAAMTSNTEERSSIIGTTTTASNLVTGLLGVVMPLALSALGEDKWTSYLCIAIPVGIFAMIMYLLSFKMVREHVVPDDSETFSLRLALKNIFTNQPLLCVQIANVFCLGGMVLRGYLLYYYSSYNLGNLALMAPLSAISTVGIVVGAILFTLLAKYIGKRNCMFGIAVIYAATNIFLYFAGWENYLLVCACAVITTVTSGAAIVCVNAMMADTIEYAEWKTGQRNEAMITSTRCFVTKCVAAIAAAAVITVIGMTGVDPTPGAVQTASALNGIHTLYTLVNACVMICAVIPMFFYKLTEKRHAEIMEELAARKAQKKD